MLLPQEALSHFFLHICMCKVDLPSMPATLQLHAMQPCPTDAYINGIETEMVKIAAEIGKGLGAPFPPEVTAV